MSRVGEKREEREEEKAKICIHIIIPKQGTLTTPNQARDDLL
jgi:hypothetical protein